MKTIVLKLEDEFIFNTKIATVDRLEQISGKSVEEIADSVTKFSRKEKLEYISCYLEDYNKKKDFIIQASSEENPLPLALLNTALQSLIYESITLGINDEERLQYFPEKKLIDEVLMKLLAR